MKFSKQIKEGLTKKGWSQKKLSEMSGINPSQISEYVHGYSEPTPERRRVIEQLLEIEQEMEVEEVVSHGNKVSVAEAARLLETTPENIRLGMLQGAFDPPIGMVIQKKQPTFLIYRSMISRTLGIEL